MLVCSVSLGASAALAADVPFRVIVTELVQLDAGVDPLGKLGDYYAKVTINGAAQDNRPACGDDPEPFGGILVPFQLFKNFDRIDDCFQSTPWIFNQTVDSTQPVAVRIQVFDDDSVTGDDEGDAFPGTGKSVDLSIDPTTGRWSGDFDWPQNCSRQQPFDLGDNRVRICWQVSFDSDGDGLLDVWETDGVDVDNDGVIDLDLANFGANPAHKDLFLELDWMPGQAPAALAIQTWKQAFAAAPLDAGGTVNPDGLPGIALWVDTGGLTDIGGQLVGDDLGGGNPMPIMNVSGLTSAFYQIKTNNFDPGRELVFRYAVSSAQPTNNVGTSTGSNSATTLNDTNQSWLAGEWRQRSVSITAGTGQGQERLISSTSATQLVVAAEWDDPIPDDTSVYQIATVGGLGERGGNDFIDFNHSASTLMHELGHTLDLGHGGGAGFGIAILQSELNCKPNYVSIMNYDHDLIFRQDGSSIIDYSPLRLVNGGRGTPTLPALDENDLDEPPILDPVDPDNLFVFSELGRCDGGNDDGEICVLNEDCESSVCASPKRLVPLNAPVDWDGDGLIAGSGLTVNIDTALFNGLAAGCQNSDLRVLQGHDDWTDISLPFQRFGDSQDAPINVAQGPEPTLEERRQINMALNAANLAIAKDTPDTVEVGDAATFDLTITNQGPNPAFKVEVVDDLPDAVSFLNASADCSEDSAGTLSCSLGTLFPGENRIFQIAVGTDAAVCPQGVPVPFTNSATVANRAEFAGPDDPSDNQAEETVTPIDETPPVIEHLSVDPDALWPPNHKMVRVTVDAVAQDICDAAPVCRITGITSNEAVNGKGDGNTAPDWVIVADLAADLRAERSGKGTGRIYMLDVECTDASGNAAGQSVSVSVAHNK